MIIFMEAESSLTKKWNYFIEDSGTVYRRLKSSPVEMVMHNLEKVRVKEWKNYLTVSIGPTGFRIHKLVARYFVPNPNNAPYVDHINGDKFDNRASNLRWCIETTFAKHGVQVKWSDKDNRGIGITFDSVIVQGSIDDRSSPRNCYQPTKAIFEMLNEDEPERLFNFIFNPESIIHCDSDS